MRHLVLGKGGFTEITRYGEWRHDPDRFGGVVTRILDKVGTPPVFCAVQDMPCEPRSLAASGLTVPMHQELTTESVCYLRAEFRHVPGSRSCKAGRSPTTSIMLPCTRKRESISPGNL